MFLFNEKTLELLANKAGLRKKEILQEQRYSLANHLYWLSHGKPGGHKIWHHIDNAILNKEYAKSLSTIKKCDTIIGYFEF